MGSCSLVVPVLTHNSRSHKSTASSKMVVSLFSLISVVLVTSSSAFVIQEEPLEQIEVKVNYGDELERLLLEAVRAGRTKEVEDILIAESVRRGKLTQQSSLEEPGSSPPLPPSSTMPQWCSMLPTWATPAPLASMASDMVSA